MEYIYENPISFYELLVVIFDEARLDIDKDIVCYPTL